MKKILVINGSASKEGNTIIVIRKFLDLFSDNDYSKEILFLSDYNIDICKGCNSCFFQGSCPLDYKDDMKVLKEKLMNSDIIIFATPVYMRNVSSYMKIFLDRLAYWSHLMKLNGKIGIIISTTASSGLDEVLSYLFNTLSHFGITVTGIIGTYFSTDEKKLYKQLKQAYGNVSDIVEYILPMFTNSYLELIFKYFQSLYNNIQKVDTTNVESNYWKEEGYFKSKTLLEIINVCDLNKKGERT